MVIFGGINSKGKYLSDVYHFDISQMKVSIAQIFGTNPYAKGVGFHTMTAIYNFDRAPVLYR